MSDKITITLTLQELQVMVCQQRIPSWLEHRYLCHPDRECEDGCDVPAIPAHQNLYYLDPFTERRNNKL